MINYLKPIFMCVIVLLVCSCQSSTPLEESVSDNSEKKIELVSPMTQHEFVKNCESVKSQLGSITRATQMTQEQAKEAMQPFVNDGLQLRTQLVQQTEADPILAVEHTYFKKLSEEDCAVLSFVYHSMIESGMQTSVINQTIDDIQTQTIQVSTERLLHCAAVAVGYDAVKKLGVGGLITATTVRQVIIAIGKRYLGYIGVALMVYDFVECIK